MVVHSRRNVVERLEFSGVHRVFFLGEGVQIYQYWLFIVPAEPISCSKGTIKSLPKNIKKFIKKNYYQKTSRYIDLNDQKYLAETQK